MDSVGQGPSLLAGWLPLTVQLVAVVLLVVAIDWRSPWTGRVWLLVSLACGALVALGLAWAFAESGLSTDGSPLGLWLWIAAAVAVAFVAVLRWRHTRAWRRWLPVVVTPVCVLAAAVVLNQWVGYFATVSEASRQIASGTLPGIEGLPALGAQRAAGPPAVGKVVEVSIPAGASNFPHRRELVYLPPAWFSGPVPPRLPAVMMIGGEFGSPNDWIRIGHATDVADRYAASHGGFAPVLVLVDANGSFENDTECVDGTQGNAAMYLTEQVVPYVQSTFAASTDPRRWGVVGWSMGGTCALDLAVMHPELFGAFVDIAGDAEPLLGDRDKTIADLYGGDVGRWAHFAPTEVLERHEPYVDTVGWFIDSADPQSGVGAGAAAPRAPTTPNQHLVEAQDLCPRAQAKSIRCEIVTFSGPHTWQFAARGFDVIFPALSQRFLG